MIKKTIAIFLGTIFLILLIVFFAGLVNQLWISDPTSDNGFKHIVFPHPGSTGTTGTSFSLFVSLIVIAEVALGAIIALLFTADELKKIVKK